MSEQTPATTSGSQAASQGDVAAAFWRRRLRGSSGLLLAGTILAVLLACLPVTDTVGQSHVDAAFKRALVGYALARGLNGVISVAQGTEIAIQPAGIGLNLTPGEILDPVNDLVERFSWIMMLASSSLGVQKVLLSMSAWQGLLLAVAVTGLLLCLCVLLPRLQNGRRLAQRLFLFVLLLRFMMPAVSIANDWVYRTFLEADYIAASATLDEAQQAIGRINEEVMAEQQEEPASMMERARALYNSALAQMDIDQRLQRYRDAAESISESTIRLVVVFLMQTLVFPLVFLFVMLGLIRRLARPWSG
ncbi:hypothetical protein ACUNV4_20625 [Granulosicoccus sp. 3-233]|uniref:hypothetical protein n=1 Tax=Granulosicoccus sp. 3-233 TaxID=3417969 RepID=UPI003D328E56